MTDFDGATMDDQFLHFHHHYSGSSAPDVDTTPSSRTPALEPLACGECDVPFPPDARETALRALFDDGVLVISCDDAGVLWSVIQDIATSPLVTPPGTWNHMLLPPAGIRSEEDPFEWVVTHGDGRDSEDEGGIVFVHVNTRDRLDAYHASLGLLRSVAAQRRIQFVILVHAASCEVAGEELHGGGVHVWALDFLEVALVRLGLTFSAAAELASEVRAQQAAGRWHLRARPFHGEVASHLRRGLSAFRDEVARRAKEAAAHAPEESPRGSGPIERALRWIATWLPEVSVTQSDVLLEVLLANVDVTTTRRKTVTSTDEAGKMVSRDEDVEEPEAALDAWKREPAKHLASARVTTPELENGASVVTLAPSESAEDVRRELGEHAIRDAFEKIDRAHLMFAPSTRPELADRLVRLASTMAVRFPDAYDEEWLYERGRLVAGVSDRTVHARYIRLCRAYLEQDDSRRFVERLLERLVGEGRSEGTDTSEDPIRRRDPTFVYSLVRALRWSSSIDEFYWIKQLVARGGNAIAERIRIDLVREAQASLTRLVTTLGELRSWQTHDTARDETRSEVKSSTEVPPLQRASLRFLFDLFRDTVDRWSRARARGRPSTPTLFAPFDEERDDSAPLVKAEHRPLLWRDARLKLVADWIAHPGYIALLPSWLRETALHRGHEFNARHEDALRDVSFTLAKTAEMSGDETAFAILDAMRDPSRGHHTLSPTDLRCMRDDLRGLSDTILGRFDDLMRSDSPEEIRRDRGRMRLAKRYRRLYADLARHCTPARSSRVPEEN